MNLKTFAYASVLMAALSACQPSPQSSTAPAARLVAPALEMKEFMKWIIDPQASFVMASVGYVTTDKGTENIAPHTDDEWNAVRNSAAILVETSSLLVTEGRSRGADWDTKARALHDSAKRVLDAVEAKDAEAVFSANGDMYSACTECHAAYLFGTQATGK